MGNPYLGEIRLVPYTYAPDGWALCDGQQLSTTNYSALYQLIGTTYGSGQGTFALPDLRGRVPVHAGTDSGVSYVLGQPGGLESVALTRQQMPSHAHAVNAAGSGQTRAPSNQALPAVATPVGANVYGPPGTNPTTLWAGTIGAAGSSQPHSNIQPYLAVNFVISLFGTYPKP